MRNEFDLVVCFTGSAACNPFLETMLAQYWDPRFFFSEWNDELINKLLRQQEELKAAGITRRVLLLVDDVILTSKADDQLAHMAMRGRHFNISLCMCAVSYTSVPKRSRRSLDILMVFSVPMKGDLQILTYEYCQNNSKVARHVLMNLKDHECLVLECLMKKQELFTWKADMLEIEDINEPKRSETEPEQARASPKNEASPELGDEQLLSHQSNTVSPSSDSE